MQTKVTEIARETYRISTFDENAGIQFNQFLIRDEEPFLMHTGLKGMFQATLEGVASIMDPAKLRWIGYSHFESDECGALNEWLATAPHAEALCGQVGCIVNLSDFAARPPRMLDDGEVMSIGNSRLQYLATPHVPHGWDAGLFYDQTEKTLFCSDLFFQPGDPEAIGATGVVEQAQAAIRSSVSGPLAHDMPYTPYTQRTLQRLADLGPHTMAVMHGSSFQGDGTAALGELACTIKGVLDPANSGM